MKTTEKTSRALITKKRDMKITPELLYKEIFVHNGKTIKKVNLNKASIGTAIGTLCITKNLGKEIHDSERNRKRKNKKKQKK